MSDTIQQRRYAAQQAALLQQRPRDLIETAENVDETLEVSFSRTMHVLYEHRNVHGANLNVAGSFRPRQGRGTALTAGTQVTLVSWSLPTTAPNVLAELDDYRPESSWTRWTGQAREALQKGITRERYQSTAAARLRVERLSALQAAFGFTIQDLAAVLGITRPQLYKWLDIANDINLQEASRVRLATVERLAKEWTSRSRAPLSSVSKEPLDEGGTALQMLTADPIDEAAVVAAFGELTARLEAKPKSLSERLRKAGYSRRPSVRSLPSDE